MSSEGVKSCPFCGSDQIVFSEVYSSFEGAHVDTYECKGCHSFARVEQWNNRYEYDALQERYECNTAIMHARTEALDRVTAERNDLSAELAALKAASGQPVNRAHVMDALLMWNRRHEEPPIKVGYEYGVAGALLYLVGAAQPAAAVDGGMVEFVTDLIDGALAGGNFDGGEIQELAVKCGLLEVQHRTESCGEHCACAEFGFPSECYRLVKRLSAHRQASQQEGEKA